MAGQKIPTSYLNLIKFVESALKKARQQNTPPWMPLVEFRRTAITYLIEGFFFFFFLDVIFFFISLSFPVERVDSVWSQRTSTRP